ATRMLQTQLRQELAEVKKQQQEQHERSLTEQVKQPLGTFRLKQEQQKSALKTVRELVKGGIKNLIKPLTKGRDGVGADAKLEAALADLRKAQPESFDAEPTQGFQVTQAEILQRVHRLSGALVEEIKRREEAEQQAGEIDRSRSESEA